MGNKEGQWEQVNSEDREGVMEAVNLDAVVQDTTPEQSSGTRLTWQDRSSYTVTYSLPK